MTCLDVMCAFIFQLTSFVVVLSGFIYYFCLFFCNIPACSIFQDSVRLPRMFNREHLHDVAPSVILSDPVGNMFQLVVQKKKNEAYFVQGWNALGKFYGLHLGGWIRLVFVRSDRFLMTIKTDLIKRLFIPCLQWFHGLAIRLKQ